MNRNEPSAELDELARAVIGAAIEVHRTLGPGLLESLYENALAEELRLRRIPFRRQVIIPMVYKDVAIGDARVDLLVADQLVVELKSVRQFDDAHVGQVLGYLRAGGYQLGLLINFNVGRLRDGIKRLIQSQ